MEDSYFLDALRRGDVAAHERLVDLYGDRLFRSALLLSGDEQVAEDLVQETFLRAIGAIKRFCGQSEVFTWLYGILLNLHRKRRRSLWRLCFTDSLPEPLIEPSESMGEMLDAATVSKLVAAALQRLSANHREVIVLHYYDGLSVDEIAGIVRVGAGTVKSRLYYARESLRRLLPPDLNLER